MDVKITTPKASTNGWLDACDIHGRVTKVCFMANSLIEKLKEHVIKQLSYEQDNELKHKLVLVNREPRSLRDNNTADEERLKNGDCVLLVKIASRKTAAATIATRSNQTYEPPSNAVIQAATANIPLQSNLPRTPSAPSSDSSSTQVEQTLRKVLLALLDLSYKFMHFETTSSMPAPPKVHVDATLVKQLIDMGFTEEHSKKALILNNMDKALAMEWLLNHTEETDETPSSSQSQGAEEPLYKYRSRSRQFKANPNHLDNLLAMGFVREESIEALRISGNNPNTACDWLLSDRTLQVDVDQPLSMDSELYKALLANPTIHIGLHDPKVVEALEDMVENPWRRNNWAYESAVGNVILQILKLYNKYSMTSTQS